MVISVDAWFDEVVPAAQLCPNPIIRKDIVNACRDLCRRSMLWTQQLAAIDVVAGQAEYPLTVSGADLVGVDRAQFDGKQMDPVSETALDEDTREPEYWRTRPIDVPKRYYVDAQYNIRLVYTPNASKTDALVVWAIVMPPQDAVEVPDFLYNEFKETITTGAKGRLLLRPNMPWSDTQLGAGFMNTYEQMLLVAQQKKFTGFQRVKTRDIVRTRYHDF